MPSIPKNYRINSCSLREKRGFRDVDLVQADLLRSRTSIVSPFVVLRESQDDGDRGPGECDSDVLALDPQAATGQWCTCTSFLGPGRCVSHLFRRYPGI